MSLDKLDPFATRQERWLISPLTRRILAVNVLALLLLAVGFLFLGQYKTYLISSELNAMRTQANMFAVALSENATTVDMVTGQYRVSNISNQMILRLVKASGARARLFLRNGALVADSRRLTGTGGDIQVVELPPPNFAVSFLREFLDQFDEMVRWLPGQTKPPRYIESPHQVAIDYPEVFRALHGEQNNAVRSTGYDRLFLSVAVPVQRYKNVLGALMLTKIPTNIEKAIYDVRIDILRLFYISFLITILLSVYLARTITRPILTLATAAEKIRFDQTRTIEIPGFEDRDDEIGDLAITLNQMTDALHLRMEAIERFAADVSHEIKNPLTSIRSAVETAARLKDPEKQRKLMKIIQDDVVRLDRLISDISDASRLDAELSRDKWDVVDLKSMLETFVDIHQSTTNTGPHLKLDMTGNPESVLQVNGIDSRLAQVLSNLINNAISFSPDGGEINIKASADETRIMIDVSDQGPGIPEGKEDKIFDRFYSERPEREKFGTHSGLGLSISRQIIQTHRGTIEAHNNPNSVGACFSISLPKA